jgi:tetratricopeptide (TPR) repeat protein
MAQTDADKTTARNLFHEGKAAYDNKRFDEAADLFARSNALYPAPTAALGLARALRDGGKLVEAFETYATILNDPNRNASSAFKTAVARAKEEHAALEPRLAAVVLEVSCECEAAVEIDDVAVPQAALGVKRFVNPGSRRIVASAAGWSSVSESVVVAEGEVKTVKLTLERTGTIEPALPDPVHPVDPPPNGEATPQTPLELPPKESPEGDDGSGLRAAGMVLGGLGLASIAVGAVTGGLYLAARSEANDRCPDKICPTAEDVANANAGHTMGLVSTITMPLGVAALGTGLLLFLLAPPSDELVMVVPSVGPSHAFLMVGKSF